MTELKKQIPDINSLVQKRHKNLRRMYQNFRDHHKSPEELIIPQLKPGRNDLCFCGSGKKYKKCCG